MKIVKIMLKRWFLLPLIIYLCLLLPWLLIYIYISPTGVGGDKTKLLKSHSFSLRITCKFIPSYIAANEYFVTSEPQGLLDEIYISSTDYMFAPAGLVFGNFDYDKEKELLVICDDGPAKSILGLRGNHKQYYNDSSLFVGYYDFQGNKFEFKNIDKSPSHWLITDWFIYGGWTSPFVVIYLYGILVGLFTGTFFLLNLLITEVYRFFSKKKEV